MADSFFSYKRKEEKTTERNVVDFNLLMDAIIDKIMDKVFERLASKKTDLLKKDPCESDKRTFKEILEEEVSKFDSIEEVQYLGEYLVELWKKIHLK